MAEDAAAGAGSAALKQQHAEEAKKRADEAKKRCQEKIAEIEKKLAEDTKKLNEDIEKMKKAAQEKISALEKKRDEDAKKATEELEKLKGKAKEKTDSSRPRWPKRTKRPRRSRPHPSGCAPVGFRRAALPGPPFGFLGAPIWSSPTTGMMRRGPWPSVMATPGAAARESRKAKGPADAAARLLPVRALFRHLG